MNMVSKQDITIVIPTLYKTKEQKFALSHSLTSLDKTVPEIRKIVVKNGGTDPLEEFTSKPETVYLETQGQCKAVNLGVKISHTPWIFVTNDDMIFPENWLHELTENLTEDTVCISPKLIEPRPGAPTFEVYFCGGAGGDFDNEKFMGFAKNYKGQGLRTGFNLPFLIKKDLWDLVEGYDENYDPWGSNSDSDLEYKIRLAGVQPYQNTNSIVYHFSQTSGTFNPENHSAWGKNWQYFINKWGFPRTDNGIWEANFHMPTTEEGRIFKPDWEGKYGH